MSVYLCLDALKLDEPFRKSPIRAKGCWEDEEEKFKKAQKKLKVQEKDLIFPNFRKKCSTRLLRSSRGLSSFDKRQIPVGFRNKTLLHSVENHFCFSENDLQEQEKHIAAKTTV